MYTVCDPIVRNNGCNNEVINSFKLTEQTRVKKEKKYRKRDKAQKYRQGSTQPNKRILLGS